MTMTPGRIDYFTPCACMRGYNWINGQDYDIEFCKVPNQTIWCSELNSVSTQKSLVKNISTTQTLQKQCTYENAVPLMEHKYVSLLTFAVALSVCDIWMILEVTLDLDSILLWSQCTCACCQSSATPVLTSLIVIGLYCSRALASTTMDWLSVTVTAYIMTNSYLSISILCRHDQLLILATMILHYISYVAWSSQCCVSNWAQLTSLFYNRIYSCFAH